MEWILIIGMTAGTFIPRYIPFVLADYFSLPPVILRALPYIPIAVISAIVAQNTLIIDGNIVLNSDNHRLLAVIPAAIVAAITKKFSWTIGVGLVIFFLLQQVM